MPRASRLASPAKPAKKSVRTTMSNRSAATAGVCADAVTAEVSISPAATTRLTTRVRTMISIGCSFRHRQYCRRPDGV
jgi:hypothetical protein